MVLRVLRLSVLFYSDLPLLPNFGLKLRHMNTTKTNAEKNTILVIGSTGKTGSRVYQELKAMGWPVRSGSRAADPGFDWLNENTWEPALQGIHAVYITFQPDLALPGAVEIIQKFTETALNQGVRKLVLLSGRGEPEAQACEQIVINSGADWTILRASWFSQNFSENYLQEPIMAGYVVLPVAEVGEPFIDVNDIAEIAIAALTDDKHNGQLYELTGPRLLSFKQAVAEIAAIIGKPVRYERIPMEDYAGAIKGQIPDEYVNVITYLFTEVLDGRNERLTDGVQRALGRKPTDFADFVKKAAAAGAWG